MYLPGSEDTQSRNYNKYNGKEKFWDEKDFNVSVFRAAFNVAAMHQNEIGNWTVITCKSLKQTEESGAEVKSAD